MGAAIIFLLMGSGFGLWMFLVLPAGTVFTSLMTGTILTLTVTFMFSGAALIIWTDTVRDYYRNQRGAWAFFVKLITFPIWLFGMIFCAWAIYETAKDVRNWSHRND